MKTIFNTRFEKETGLQNNFLLIEEIKTYKETQYINTFDDVTKIELRFDKHRGLCGRCFNTSLFSLLEGNQKKSRFSMCFNVFKGESNTHLRLTAFGQKVWFCIPTDIYNKFINLENDFTPLKPEIKPNAIYLEFDEKTGLQRFYQTLEFYTDTEGNILYDEILCNVHTNKTSSGTTKWIKTERLINKTKQVDKMEFKATYEQVKKAERVKEAIQYKFNNYEYNDITSLKFDISYHVSLRQLWVCASLDIHKDADPKKQMFILITGTPSFTNIISPNGALKSCSHHFQKKFSTNKFLTYTF